MNVKIIKHAIKSFVAALKTKNIVPIEHQVDERNILQGHVALIIGGSGGIGYAIAKSFLESGCKVIITGTNANKLKYCVKELGERNVQYMVLDLNEVCILPEKIDSIGKMYGKIDILVNSAGIHSTRAMTDFFNTTEEDFNNILDINLKGTYFVSQAIAKYMVNNKIKGHILNISSSTGAEPAWSPYRLSKLGVEGFTRGLAQTLTPYGITVNAIAPGSTATNLLNYSNGDSIYTADNAVGRYIMPDEVASYAKILVSDLGNMVVGSTLYVSGGRGTYDIR